MRRAVLKVYPGAPHGLAETERDKLNADLLAFLKDCRPEALAASTS
jgi:non-heme chloroperoxidase